MNNKVHTSYIQRATVRLGERPPTLIAKK